MKITDRQGNEFEVVRGEVPEQWIDKKRTKNAPEGVVVLKKFNFTTKIAAAAGQAKVAHPELCEHEVNDLVAEAVGAPVIMLEAPEGRQRILAHDTVDKLGINPRAVGIDPSTMSTEEAIRQIEANPVMARALERPNAAFYAGLEASAENERISLLAQQVAVEQSKATVDEALTQDALDLAGWKALLTLHSVEEVHAEITKIGSLREAKSYADRYVDSTNKVLVQIDRGIEQAIYARNHNGKAKTVADGVKCVCQVSADAENVR